MKNLLLILIVLATSSALSAQSLPKVNKPDLQSTVEDASSQAGLSEDQIKEALMKDEDLQTETINFLKKNPDTKNAMAKLAMGGMGASLGSSTGGLMKSILGDQNLAAAAISFVQSNPKLLSQAMKVLGM
ncbi:MAG: hypothetical protein RIC80_04740 [Cyclobacteriaceae bacterium]